MQIVCLILELHLPGCGSLKEKRGRLKPLLAALHREYNISAAEIDLQDVHQSAVLACVLVSNSRPHGEKVLSRIPRWIESHRPDLALVDFQIRPI